MSRFPGDSRSLRTDRRAVAIVHYLVKSEDWEFRLLTGQDVGCDCEIELSQDNKWTGRVIKLQIKGTSVFEKHLICSGGTISFPLEVKTINYALGSPSPFLFVVVDVENERAHYVELHDYFCRHDEQKSKLTTGQQKLNLHIPLENSFADGNQILKELAASVYMNGARVFLPAGD